METKICNKCFRELPLSEFYTQGKGKYRADCKECHKRYVKKNYYKRKEEINNIKKEQCCQKCGEKRFYLLDFHHINPENKNETVARMTANTNSVEKILDEIDKCICLCANCHREFHYFEREKGITLEEYLNNL